MRIRNVIGLGLVFVSALTSSVRAENWAGWRNDGTGVARRNLSPPVRWSPTQNIQWKVAIPGTGHSSPIVWQDSIILTTAFDGIGQEASRRHWTIVMITAAVAALLSIVASWFISKSGHRQSERASSAEAPQSRSRMRRFLGSSLIAVASGGIACAVAWQTSHPDSQTLRYAMCIDRDSGAIRWQTQCAAGPLLGSTTMTSAATPTPTTDGKFIYVHFGRTGTFCLDLEGRIVWQNREPVPEILYKAGSSPVLWNDLLIVTHDTDTRLLTVALDKHDGSQRWQIERTPPTPGRRSRMDAYSTPIIVRVGKRDVLVHDSYRHLSGHDPATGRILWSVPTDAEQIVTSPVAAGDLVVFSGECNHPIHMTAIRLVERDDGGISTGAVWTTKKQVPVVSSPAIRQDRVYSVSKSGIATCRRLQTGDVVWRHRLAGRYYASVTIAGDHVYFANLDGVTTIMAADDEARVIATNTLSESIYASPAFCDDTMFLRTDAYLYAIANRSDMPVGTALRKPE